MLKAINLSNKAEIGDRIQTAFSFWPRLKGLLGRKALLAGEGLLIHPCSSIHCMGMRFAIDVLYLDSEFNVLKIREHMKPGVLGYCKGASYVLELPAGLVQSKKIRCGDYLSFLNTHDES